MNDIRDAIFDTIEKKMSKDKRIILLSVDQGSFGYQNIKRKFKNRCFNLGISEQNIISVASGLSLEGKIVFVYGISSFLYSRAYEQIKLNLASLASSVCLLASGPGYCYASDGPSHYSLEDINLFNALPNFKIFSPYDIKSGEKSIDDFIKNKKPTYIRVDKGSYEVINKQNNEFFFINNKGYKKLIISHGFFGKELYKNRELIKRRNISILLLSKLKPLDEKKINLIIKKYNKIAFIDESFLNSSFGLYLSYLFKIKNIKIYSSKNEFFKKSGNREFIHKSNDLDILKILHRF